MEMFPYMLGWKVGTMYFVWAGSVRVCKGTTTKLFPHFDHKHYTHEGIRNRTHTGLVQNRNAHPFGGCGTVLIDPLEREIV